MGHRGVEGTDDEGGSWKNRAKCRQLSPAEADALFFPGRGGKSKRAEKFCSTCPVEDKCVVEAIVTGALGFWAGTTEPERERMADFLKLVPAQLDGLIPEPTARSRRLRKIPSNNNPLNDPLYGVDGPSRDEELRMYGL